ncbi:hypothetical protein AZE42_06220 [Rhizopogon vesiculosus]|uniref:MYND-type domain-containing protein n=1 Tax=Rhizopogon vesiculosus TaxID=180088 RepID=A0A1J8PV89_9AGAM|nr:hypothetical protein AZE42_06220 [Rhizopogon vesiculosus]
MPNNRKNKMPQSLLRNGVNFPTFSDLPDEYEVDLTYYNETPRGFEPSQHWCFLGEIVDFFDLVRVMMYVKDKDGRVITVALHTDDKGRSLAPQVKKGHTVAVLYGQQHGFLDMSVGIRVEEASNIKIIPCSLDQLLKASDEVAARKPGQPRRCGSCGQEENTSEDRQLRWCSRCKHASYCGEDCQKKAWADGHKADCKVLVGVQWFAARDWRRFHDWFSF